MKNQQRLIDKFFSNHPALAIATIEALRTEEIGELVASQIQEHGLFILSRLAPYKAGKVLEHLEQEQAIRYIEQMQFAAAESILRVCDDVISEKVINGLQQEKANYLRRALQFKKEQIGAHLDPYVFTLKESFTVEKALALIKASKAAVKPEVFVINDDKILIGHVSVTDLLKTRPEKMIHSLIKQFAYTVFAEMNVKDLLDSWDDQFTDLPVVKVDGEFMGTVSRLKLSSISDRKSPQDNSALKAGNALGELYTIGLTSLLGSAEAGLKS